jgi:hypothetical protein
LLPVVKRHFVGLFACQNCSKHTPPAVEGLERDQKVELNHKRAMLTPKNASEKTRVEFTYLAADKASAEPFCMGCIRFCLRLH